MLHGPVDVLDLRTRQEPTERLDPEPQRRPHRRADPELPGADGSREAGAPEQTAPQVLFVRRVFEEIHASGIEDQVTIQSFAWGALTQIRE